MAHFPHNTTTFGRLANRIRNFFSHIFKVSRPNKRQVEGKLGCPVRALDLIQVDRSPKYFNDGICWDVLEGSPTETSVTAGKTEESVGPMPDPIVASQTEVMVEQVFSEDSNTCEVRNPSSSSASKQELGSLSLPQESSSQFLPFSRLPSELRLKIWYFTIEPRLVHHNVLGARKSRLKIEHQPPIILQVCHESRSEGLRVLDLNPEATRPFFFDPRADTFLWTRYHNCPKRMVEDVERLVNSSTLRRVRHMAINIHLWSKLLSDVGPKIGYTAIRKAPGLQVLTLVDDYPVRRHTSKGLIKNFSGMEMKLVDVPPADCHIRKSRWKKEILKDGKEKVWKLWDVNLTDSEGLPRRVPEIRFASAVLAKS